MLSTRRSEEFDVVVVGAGIVGLGTAWAAQRLGLKTLLLERSNIACGASVRNFGMLWPLGQPAGPRRHLAMRSRELWLELSRKSKVWLAPCGSLHLAHHPDEWQILQEFVDLPEEAEQPFELLTPAETLHRTDLARRDGLLGSLYSPHECRVAPRQAIPGFAEYLQSLDVEVCFGEAIVNIDQGTVTSSSGQSWHAKHVFVCSGADFAYLYPQQHAAANLTVCKLHMWRTQALPLGHAIGPHLASGLTLRHYESFQPCAAWTELQQRIASTAPELNQFGIHVMVSQDAEGHLVLGDSHEYGDDVDPFDKAIIDELMLRELRKVYELPTWQINARWTGTYAKCMDQPWLQMSPEPNVTIINGFGGAGMTLSLAVTEQVVREATCDAALCEPGRAEQTSPGQTLGRSANAPLA